MRLSRRLRFVRPVAFVGTLYDLGDFPGVVLEPAVGTVHGELYAVTDPALFDDLDDFEQFRPHDPAPFDPRTGLGSLYLRRSLPLEDLSAEIYLWNLAGDRIAPGPVIASGDWIKHRRGNR